MIDITPQLRSFAAAKASWATGRSVKIAKALGRVSVARIDWDEDAGENWIRVITGVNVIAMVSTLGPLVIVSEEIAEMVNTDQFEAVIVSNMEDATLAADIGTLVEAFDRRIDLSPALDPACFTANELWFVSV